MGRDNNGLYLGSEGGMTNMSELEKALFRATRYNAFSMAYVFVFLKISGGLFREDFVGSGYDIV